MCSEDMMVSAPTRFSMTNLIHPIPVYEDRERIAWANAKVQFSFDRPESSDPLESAEGRGIATDAVYAQADGLNFPYCRKIARSKEILLRRSVLDRLERMRDQLRTIGLEPVVLDGYRDLETQGQLWADIHERVSRGNDEHRQAETRAVAKQYCTDPHGWSSSDPMSWPVHSTGGSIDMTLRKVSSGEYLFMGSLFDDPHEISHADFFERRLSASKGQSLTVSEEAALRNRRILYNAALAVGLNHYWAEWWHFDYGTLFYARANAVTCAEPIAFYRTAAV